ncbi:Cathepsin D (Ddp44) [Durusdinium trenchii]|uniref:Cathepsin D (Ddp44) n=1 Tax=Durusdinium trenchii TaxID=1381693 RepID=A0ABP0RU71_9DINO
MSQDRGNLQLYQPLTTKIERSPMLPGFQSVDVSGDSHWATKLSKFKADTFGVCNFYGGALIDSGTSLLTFPRSASHITEALKRKVKSDCSNLDELPTLFFELDGAEVVLPPKAYIFKVTEEDGSPACRGAFMKVDKVGM